jgi:RNA polymerase sigma-70 factor (ECF subfamily)
MITIPPCSETHRPTWSVLATDEDLVNLVLLNDQTAFARIVEKHRGWVYALCSRILRSRDKADDAAQEVFALALEKMATLQHRAKLAGWLKVIAVNQCRKILEKGRVWDPSSNVEGTRCGTISPEEQIIASERCQLVGELISLLPPKQRLVFVMKYMDGDTYQRISELTGFSDKQVKSYLQNARRNFERWWTNGPHRPLA